MKLKLKNPYILYTSSFVVIWSVIMLPFFLRGNSLIGESDSFNQSFPVFVYIGNYIRELFQGNLIQFDFRLGLGDDAVLALNTHGLGDILQIVSVFVSAEQAEPMYEFVMILKYYLSGIAFLVYSKIYLKSICYRVAGALMYACSVFALVWGLNCWMFLNPMITLPFVLYGMEQIMLNGRKLSLPMILALFIQALNGFYFLYMEIIIAIIFFLVVSVSRLGITKESVKKMTLNATAVAIQGLLGVLLGAVLLIPSIIGYLSSSRTGSVNTFQSIIDLFIFRDKGNYIRNFGSLLIPDAYTSVITIPVILLMGSILIFMGKNKKKDINALTIFFSISFLLPVIGSLMNGFSYWVDRWYFAVLLFLILGVMQTAEETIMAGRREIIVFWIIVGCSISVHVLISEKSLGLIMQCAIVVLEAAVIPFIWNCVEKRERKLLISVVILSIINGLLIFGPKILGGSGYSAGFKATGACYREIRDSVKEVEVEDSEFQRLDIYGSSLSSSLVMNYYGTTEYFSMLNSYVSEFFREMYISPGVRSATWILKGLDGRCELEALLSASHYMDFETDDEGKANFLIRENSERLPLGFTYTKYLGRDEFDKLNILEKSNAMVNSVVLENTCTETLNLVKARLDEVRNSKKDKEISIILDEKGVEHSGQYFKTADKAKIRVYLEEADENVEYYVKLSDFCLLDEGTQDIYVGNKNIQLRNQEDAYYMGDDEFWIHVSELKEESGGHYFDIILGGNKTYSLGNIQVFSHMPDEKALLDRKSNTLQNVEVKVNSISGKMFTDTTQALFLSIPYSRGWTAYVDGVETEIERANIAFMALILSPGEHEIVLNYRTPGIRIGMILSAVSGAIIILWKCWEKKDRKCDNRKRK